MKVNINGGLVQVQVKLCFDIISIHQVGNHYECELLIKVFVNDYSSTEKLSFPLKNLQQIRKTIELIEELNEKLK